MEEKNYDIDFEQAYEKISQEHFSELEEQKKQVETQRGDACVKTFNTLKIVMILFIIMFVCANFGEYLGKFLIRYPFFLMIAYIASISFVIAVIYSGIKALKKEDLSNIRQYEKKNEEIVNQFLQNAKIFSKYNFSKIRNINKSYDIYKFNSLGINNDSKYSYSKRSYLKGGYFYYMSGELNNGCEFANVNILDVGLARHRGQFVNANVFAEIKLNKFYEQSSLLIGNDINKLELYIEDDSKMPDFFTAELKEKLLNYYKEYPFEVIIEGNRMYIGLGKIESYFYYASRLSMKDYFYEIYKSKKFLLELANDLVRYMNDFSQELSLDSNVDIIIRPLVKRKEDKIFPIIFYVLFILGCIIAVIVEGIKGGIISI